MQLCNYFAQLCNFGAAHFCCSAQLCNYFAITLLNFVISTQLCNYFAHHVFCALSIYIFLNFTYPIDKKNWDIFPGKNKSIFSKPKTWLVQLNDGFRVSSVKHTQTGDLRHHTMTVNSFDYLLFNNVFMIRSMIILTAILSSKLSAFSFKFKTGFHVKVYHLSLATCKGEWLLRMIPSVC